ncbi:6332_t:CDS:2, partial [Cetraspora pellucida]
DISKDLEDVSIDSSKESNNPENVNTDLILFNNILRASNNLLDSYSEKNSDKLDKLVESDELNKMDELESDDSNKLKELDNLLNNENFKNIINKALNFEKLL